MTVKRKITVCPCCFSTSISKRVRAPRNYKCYACKRTFKVPAMKECQMKPPVPMYMRPKKEVMQ